MNKVYFLFLFAVIIISGCGSKCEREHTGILIIETRQQETVALNIYVDGRLKHKDNNQQVISELSAGDHKIKIEVESGYTFENVVHVTQCETTIKLFQYFAANLGVFI